MTPDVQDFVTRLNLHSSPPILKILRDLKSAERLPEEERIRKILRLMSSGLDSWWSTHGPLVLREVSSFQRQLMEMMQTMLYIHLKA